MKQTNKILDWMTWCPEERQQCIDYANEAIKRVVNRLNIEQYNNPDNTREAVFEIMYCLVETEIAPENPDTKEYEMFNSLMENSYDYNKHCYTHLEIHKILEQYIKDNFKNLVSYE